MKDRGGEGKAEGGDRGRKQEGANVAAEKDAKEAGGGGGGGEGGIQS